MPSWIYVYTTPPLARFYLCCLVFGQVIVCVAPSLPQIPLSAPIYRTCIALAFPVSLDLLPAFDVLTSSHGCLHSLTGHSSTTENA